MQIRQARRYIDRIKNPAKRDYAEQYWLYLTGCREEPRPIMIGTMAAQAVRMWLNNYYETINA